MSWFSSLKKQKAGEVIEARTLRETAEVAEWSSRIRAAAPLAITSTAAGPLIRLAGAIFGAYVAVANGTITARSGATPGTGSATIQTWNGTVLASLGIDLPVLNWNSAAGGITTGKYCVLLKIYGVYWVVAAEC